MMHLMKGVLTFLALETAIAVPFPSKVLVDQLDDSMFLRSIPELSYSIFNYMRTHLGKKLSLKD